jgi:excisionase family DNA binding protein
MTFRPTDPGAHTVGDSEARPVGRRLLSPSEAAAYLGLTSRFAIYRLVASGALPAIRLANKLRLDLRDLDAAIENAKSETARPKAPLTRRPNRPRTVPRELAPLPRRQSSVTTSVTAGSRRQ